MSDRDDIDVIDNAVSAKSGSESVKPEDYTNSNNKFNQAIRQNPLTHSGEKSEKPGIFEKLKRAFSTDETPNDDVSDSEEQADEGLIDDGGSVFGSFVNRFKRNQENVGNDTESDETDIEEIIDSVISAEDETEAEEPDIKKDDFDPEEEEEFRMISAFLEGEEYIPSESGKPELSSENNNKPEESDSQSENNEENIEPVAETEISQKNEEPETPPEDSVKSGDESEKNDTESEEYDVRDALENEKTEFDVQDALENEEAEFDAQDALENEEAEFDAQDAFETEFVMIDIDDEESSEKPDEIKNPEDTYGEKESVSVNEQIPEPKGTDENPDGISAEEKSEKDISEVSDEPKPVPENSQDSIDPEPEKENKEDTQTKKDDKESAESVDGASKSEKKSAPDEYEEDDEEFQFDDDFVFDESDDEEFNELTNIDSADDLNNPDNIIEDTPKARQESAPEKSEEASSGENTEKSENNENSKSEENEEKKTETAETESKNFDHGAVSDAVNSEEKTQNAEELSKKEKSPENEKSEEPVESKDSEPVGNSEKFVDISSNSDKPEVQTDTKQKKNNPFVKFRSLYSRTKNRLFEMWNAKEEEPKNEKKIESEKPDAVLKTEPLKEEEKTVSQENTADDINVVTESGNAAEVEKSVENKNNSAPDAVFESDSEETPAEIKEISGEEFIDISDTENSAEDKLTGDETKSSNVIPMTVIKNENKPRTELDVDRMRESLNVIEGEKNVSEPDILTEEQKRQSELNQKVLEKVKQYEDETAEKREELRKAREERSAKAYEKAFGTVDPITEIEITDYIVPGIFDEIKVKAGKFTESVRSEYEFYVGYSRLKNVAKKQAKIEPADSVPNSGDQSGAAASSEKNETRYEDFADDRFAKSRDRLDSISKRLDYRDSKHPVTIEYRSEEDASKVRSYLQKEYKQAKLQWNIALALTFVMFVVSCFAGKFTIGAGETAKDSSERLFAFLNIVIYGAMLYNCRDIIVGGLLPLKKIRSNSDTGTAVAAAVTAIQSLIALIAPSPFLRQGLNVYTLLVMLALSVNALGRNMNAHRIVSNFRFVSDSSQKYTGKFFHDQRMVATLLSGTRNDKSELVFQKKTSFLKHFVKLSYSSDPGEDLADKFSLPTIVFSVIISIVYGFIAKSFLDAVSVLCVMLCAAVPMCAKALGAIPLHKLAKNSLANQSMVVGYQAVDNFSESAAVMIDAKELYPEGSVHLNGIKTFDSRRIDDAMLAAASVIITAGGAMAGMFDGIIQGDKQENLPTAEGVMYEDGKGLIGWVNNERIFVGNRRLLLAHGIEPMTEDYEDEQKDGGNEILYLACAGELVAMFIVGYSANRRVADALRRMEANGMSLLIRTTDVNITADRIAKDFGVSHRSIKILEQKNSNVIRDEMIGKEKASPAFIATKGGVTSFGRAVSGCIQTKRNISLSLAVQIVGVLLGLLIVTLIVLFAGVHHIGAIQLFMFYLFWVIAVLAAPPIIQKIQKY